MIDPPTRLRRAIHLSNPALCARILRTHPTLPLSNPDFSDKSNTSLHLAALHNSSPEIVSLLITLGHDRTSISRNSDHNTPLMLAAEAGRTSIAILLAREFPQSVGMRNKLGMDALALAAGNAEAGEGLISALLSSSHGGASVHSRDNSGNTPLHHASASGALKAMRILLAHGADPFAKNSYDWTPLAYSVTVAAEVYMKNLVAEFARRRAESGVGGVRLVVGEQEDEDEVIGDVLRRHWSPTDARRREGLGHVRTRSGS